MMIIRTPDFRVRGANSADVTLAGHLPNIYLARLRQEIANTLPKASGNGKISLNGRIQRTWPQMFDKLMVGNGT